MATDKYDLHTIDYSVQGWDAIMATDMEILDDEVNTRILATLGETVAVSDALYMHTDGKYYKAKSDGTKQPAMGLAIETGILDDSIRIQRVGPMTDAGWSWSDVGKIIFLSSTTAGDLTETEPATNAQAVGVVLSATSIFIDIELPTTVSGAGGGVSNHSELNELDYASAGHTGFSPDTHTHDDRYYTESEVDTISGTLQTNIDEKAVTLLELTDTPGTYDDNKYLRSTTTGTEWATVSGNGSNDHSELSNLAYADSGHTGFSPTSHEHVSTEITVSKINTPTYDTLQEWIDNTQSAGRMSGGATSTHTDAVTGVTVGGAGSGEFKVSGDQTAGYAGAVPIRVTDSTNNDGYYTVISGGSSYSGGTTTIPVDEAVGAVADGDIVNGTVDVATGTGFIKTTDSDIGTTVSFDLPATTNITLTDVITNYVYIDYNAGVPNINTTTDEDSIEYNRQFPLSMVYRNGARTWVCDCGIYLPNRTRLDHERILLLRGYERASGGEISEYGTRNIQSTIGVFFRGPAEINTTAKASATDKTTTVYYDGADWVWTEDEAQIDNAYYNNTATGLVELTSGRYAVHWVCIDYLSNLYVVYGRGDYTLPQAELASLPSLMPVVAYEFGIVAAKIIVQKAASSFTEVISAYKQLFPSATPTSHNNLSGLNDGDYKHLTATNHTDLTDSGVCTIHKHDINEDTDPTLGGQLEVGEHDIKLDSLLSADGKYSGKTCDGILGATLAYGDLVYLNNTDQRWELTDANAEATSGNVELAIVLAGGNDGDTRLLLKEGYVREDDWNFTLYGKALYVSTTAGDMTQITVSGTGNIGRIVGHASTFADQIYFKPSGVWVEI